MHITIVALVLLAGPIEVESQHLDVTLDPAAHTAAVEATITAQGHGPFPFLLTEHAVLEHLALDGAPTDHRRGPSETDRVVRIEVDWPEGRHVLTVRYHARFEQDVAAGERPGRIHNFSVDAHLGGDGIFLSDGSAWHPRPVDERERPVLHAISIDIEPMDGWALVASGDPRDEGGLETARWRWGTPRPVAGAAIAGNHHEIVGAVHETPFGPVEIVMHVSRGHAPLAPLFVEAAGEYLDLYTPRLGAFPYRRFTIVENFFSSGFAFPGFTLLGPQVVAMAPRSLAPGYLDHELVHNWWGNGVYVDPDDGNWCEALTSYCANYGRRVAEGGAAAGIAYRRGILMKLSSDPDALDDGPLGQFGSADPSSPGPGRFVGYEKGTFVFSMLADVIARGGPDESGTDGDDPMWASLRRLAERHLGQRVGWDEIQDVFEAQRPDRDEDWLGGFFRFWVRESGAPRTLPAAAFVRQFPPGCEVEIDVVHGPGNTWWEIDPDFKIYRALPPEQIVPTIAGTLGQGGVVVEHDPARPEATALLPQLESTADGENLFLIGDDAIRARATLIARTGDPVTVDAGSFTVGGVRYEGREQTVLHTMRHPERPGRFITVFHSNGKTGWSRLRLVRFYTRDTTIVWEGSAVLDRRVFEPDRRITVP